MDSTETTKNHRFMSTDTEACAYHVEHRGLCIRLVFIRLTPRHFLKLGLQATKAPQNAQAATSNV